MLKKNTKGLQDTLNECVKQKLPFVFYRLPHKEEVSFIGQTSKGNNTLSESSGFMFHPFQRNEITEPCFIKCDSHFAFGLSNLSEVVFKIKDVSVSDLLNIQVTKEQFCKSVEKAVETIKQGNLNKVILSRVEEVNIELEPLEVFVELCKKYGSAFISLVVVPGETCWITASPELLVSLEGKNVKTVALAGTKPIGSSAWGKKEKVEQQIVTDYIEGILKDNCTNIKVSVPMDVIAGNVMHLKTEFSAILTTDLKQLISELHPTPAVWGMPKDKAIAFINDTELHKRKYYAGYLGPYNMNGRTDLFVNLRCAELFNGKADLFIGGGITAGSEPEKEWNETVLKSQTLLSVMVLKAKTV